MPSTNLTDLLTKYLKDCGEREKRIEACHMDTRLFHDLGIYGEAAEDYIDVLVNQYNVDMTGFDFARYFPPEFAGKTMLTRALIWTFPYIWKLFSPRDEGSDFLPLTLEMIEQAIHQKRWPSSEVGGSGS
jgi:hypothetical protein